MLRQAEERSRNVAWTCRHFGISRKTFYKWKRRFEAEGLPPSTRAPAATSKEVARPHPHEVPRLLPLVNIARALLHR